jgi:hypothetical protein
MSRFFRPNQLSIALFILFLVFLVTPLAIPNHFGFSMGFFSEYQKSLLSGETFAVSVQVS